MEKWIELWMVASGWFEESVWVEKWVDGVMDGCKWMV